MKRWPIIRHVRWLWSSWLFHRWWTTVGCHYWLHPNTADLDYLDAVWEGRK